MLESSILLSTVIAAGPVSAGAEHTSAALLAEEIMLDLKPAAVPLEDSVALALLQDEPSGGEEAEALPDDGYTRVTRYGAKGSRRWNIRGGMGVDIKDGNNTLGLLGVGWSFFIADALSLDIELQGMAFRQDRDSGEGLNANLILRWHFINERNWSMYIDGGSGVLGTTQDVPEYGSSFNFSTQAGAGFTFALGEGARLMTGARWYHVSNANLYEDNPGRDFFMGYAGVSFPF